MPDEAKPAKMFAQIGGNTPYVLINQYGDKSALLAAYGPFPTKTEAEAARQAFVDVELGDVSGWEVLPLRDFMTFEEES